MLVKRLQSFIILKVLPLSLIYINLLFPHFKYKAELWLVFITFLLNIFAVILCLHDFFHRGYWLLFQELLGK